ncbi:ABC transporter ATP-binding protein [Corynebacterium sp. TAE3-ERU2]|uniref:ABC transporter ATP-binding protein n=1 Tax=Corynebacterium sp. TAE3-ERU2 TaxID=2849497 RepID=UPI001C461905|nr:ABC transporter ATP-binding protein [Corynebacterium sp. TAE3-ERU2]MBV7303008.1 ABC transporter ATP-binding protein [Corynebacterium sp. TAE3-ERU2]
MTRLIARALHASYGRTDVLKGVDLSIGSGITTIIGPNGCGKSTLLKALSRLIPSTGAIELDGKDLRTLPRKTLARTIAVLPQSPIAPEGVVVSDLVARGRHPHQSWIRQWSDDDAEHVDKALTLTHCVELADRRLDSLSGGQRQRVWISMVLAQETSMIFLDEPTTYLDLTHSIDVLNLVARLRDAGTTIVMVLHDLNLAARYSDHLIVVNDGEIRAAGPPGEIVTPAMVKDVFNLDALVIDDPATGSPLVVPDAPRW